eukprot:tig00021073_g18048.t1
MSRSGRRPRSRARGLPPLEPDEDDALVALQALRGTALRDRVCTDANLRAQAILDELNAPPRMIEPGLAVAPSTGSRKPPSIGTIQSLRKSILRSTWRGRRAGSVAASVSDERALEEAAARLAALVESSPSIAAYAAQNPSFRPSSLLTAGDVFKKGFQDIFQDIRSVLHFNGRWRSEHTELSAGDPHIDACERDQYRHFVFRVLEPGRVDITLSAIKGDPDLFVCCTNEYPTQDAHTWRSAGEGSDSITLSFERVPTLVYIGVRGAAEGENKFRLTAGSKKVIQLVPGEPVVSSVKPGKYAYFKYHHSARGKSVRIKLTSLKGDTDLFVCVTNQTPTEEKSTWKSNADGDDVVTIWPSDPNYRYGWYFVGVRGFELSKTDLEFEVVCLAEKNAKKDEVKATLALAAKNYNKDKKKAKQEEMADAELYGIVKGGSDAEGGITTGGEGASSDGEASGDGTEGGEGGGGGRGKSRHKKKRKDRRGKKTHAHAFGSVSRAGIQYGIPESVARLLRAGQVPEDSISVRPGAAAGASGAASGAASGTATPGERLAAPPRSVLLASLLEITSEGPEGPSASEAEPGRTGPGARGRRGAPNRRGPRGCPRPSARRIRRLRPARPPRDSSSYPASPPPGEETPAPASDADLGGALAAPSTEELFFPPSSSSSSLPTDPAAAAALERGGRHFASAPQLVPGPVPPAPAPLAHAPAHAPARRVPRHAASAPQLAAGPHPSPGPAPAPPRPRPRLPPRQQRLPSYPPRPPAAAPAGPFEAVAAAGPRRKPPAGPGAGPASAALMPGIELGPAALLIEEPASPWLKRRTLPPGRLRSRLPPDPRPPVLVLPSGPPPLDWADRRIMELRGESPRRSPSPDASGSLPPSQRPRPLAAAPAHNARGVPLAPSPAPDPGGRRAGLSGSASAPLLRPSPLPAAWKNAHLLHGPAESAARLSTLYQSRTVKLPEVPGAKPPRRGAKAHGKPKEAPPPPAPPKPETPAAAKPPQDFEASNPAVQRELEKAAGLKPPPPKPRKSSLKPSRFASEASGGPASSGRAGRAPPPRPWTRDPESRAASREARMQLPISNSMRIRRIELEHAPAPDRDGAARPAPEPDREAGAKPDAVAAE